MIHYQLRCGAAHEFDAWFRDSAAYEEQAGSLLLECPHCGERQVARALMTPAVPRKGRKRQPSAVVEAATEAPAAPNPPAPPMPAPSSQIVARMPDQMRAVLQRMRVEVERRCEYVGDGFAAEVRRIHGGDSQKRGIYGEATPEEAEALADDGIEVAQIPWLPRADA